MKAVILAGGKGTRLSEYTKEIPKPLLKIEGKTIIEYQLESLKKSGIVEIIMIIGHLGEKIQEYFKDGSDFGVNIEYIKEEKPLGTAGGLSFIKDKIGDDFILTYGDIVFDIDFNRFIDFHKSKKSICTLSTHPNNHPYDSDVIIIDEHEKVKGIIRKDQERDFYYDNLVNAGVFIVSKNLLKYIKSGEKQDFEKDILLNILDIEEIYSYKTTEYIKDMGTPDRYELVKDHIKKGLVKYKNLKNKQKAIFLDRDGTLNKHVGLLHEIEQFELESFVVEALERINNSEYLSIVVTNQPVIARNLCSIEELEEIHKKLQTILGEKRVYIDEILYCPHHPDSGYKGENKKYKIKCECRKPSTGLIEKMIDKYNIDIENSYIIGDTTVDIQTGKNSGMKTILLSTGEGGKDYKHDVKPDFLADNLLEAVKIIIKR